MPWNHDTKSFDPPLDFPITREDLGDLDDDQGIGLVVGIAFGVGFWTLLILSWRFAAIGTLMVGVVKVLTVVGVLFAVVWASNRLVLRWRNEHPDNPFVDWLRRSGL